MRMNDDEKRRQGEPGASDAPNGGERMAWSIRSLARATDLPVSTLYERIRRGEGPRIRKVGRRFVVLDADAIAWLATLPVLGIGIKHP